MADAMHARRRCGEQKAGSRSEQQERMDGRLWWADALLAGCLHYMYMFLRDGFVGDGGHGHEPFVYMYLAVGGACLHEIGCRGLPDIQSQCLAMEIAWC